jgi:hypothetical protein
MFVTHLSPHSLKKLILFPCSEGVVGNSVSQKECHVLWLLNPVWGHSVIGEAGTSSTCPICGKKNFFFLVNMIPTKHWLAGKWLSFKRNKMRLYVLIQDQRHNIKQTLTNKKLCNWIFLVCW